MLSSLIWGLEQAVSLENIIYCFVGIFLGTVVGVIPGLGPGTTLAILLPSTFYLSGTGSIIMMSGVYYGAQYGGSTTAILMKVAGEGTSIPTIAEGNILARNGKAGLALSISALSSFFAGVIVTILICFFSTYFAELVLKFGPSEYVCLGLLAIFGSIFLSNGDNYLQTCCLLSIGLLFGSVGIDSFTGSQRFTLGILDLYDGVGIAAFAIGTIAIGEVLKNLSLKDSHQSLEKITTLYPSKEDLRRSVAPTLRGTAVGTVLGLLPGGALFSSFASFFIEKKFSRYKNEFGKGAIEGVAGPEAANNAGAQSSFIPTLTIGVPPNTAMAMVLGAMTIHGLIPGPQFILQSQSIFWVLLASMLIGNLLLLILNLPLVGIWTKLLSIPKKYLNFLILLLCCIGVYKLNSSIFETSLILFFGIIGFIVVYYDLDVVSMIIGFLIGPMIEEQFRRSMMLSKGSLEIFWQSNINIAILAILLSTVIYSLVAKVKHGR